MTILFINKRNIHSLFSITSSKNGSKIMLFLYNSLYDFLGYFMCVLLFALILHCICPTFFLVMCSPCTSRGLLVPLDSYFSTFMMNWNFGAPYIVQFSHSLTNAIVPSMQASLMQRCLTVALLRSFSKLPRTILHFPKFLLGSLTSTSSLVAQ